MDTRKAKSVMTFSDASNLVRENMLMAVLIPHWIFSLPIVPKKLMIIGRAINSLKEHMACILAKEIYVFKQGVQGSGNLMSQLVRYSEEAQDRSGGIAHQSKDQVFGGLSIEEIFGNMYIFSLAGHETTGNSLAFAIYLLAANQEVQSWVAEEVQEILKDQVSGSIPHYTLFPRFKRCLAVLVCWLINILISKVAKRKCRSCDVVWNSSTFPDRHRSP